MAAATLISMDEYLETSYSADCGYIDGVVVERHVGEKPHSKVHRRIILSLGNRYEALGVPYIWLIDQRRKKAFTLSAGRREEVQGNAFVTAQPVIQLPLEEILRGL